VPQKPPSFNPEPQATFVSAYGCRTETAVACGFGLNASGDCGPKNAVACGLPLND
jgi:hypothetical protein